MRHAFEILVALVSRLDIFKILLGRLLTRLLAQGELAWLILRELGHAGLKLLLGLHERLLGDRHVGALLRRTCHILLSLRVLGVSVPAVQLALGFPVDLGWLHRLCFALQERFRFLAIVSLRFFDSWLFRLLIKG